MSKLADAFVELRVQGMQAVTSALGTVRGAMGRLGQAAKEMAERFGRAMKGLADSVGAGFINRWTQFLSLMKSSQAFTANLVTTFAAAGIRAGKALADGLSTKIGGASAAIGQKLRAAFSRLTVGNIDIGLARLLFALNDLPGKAGDAVARMRGAFDTLRSTVGGVAGGIQQRLTNAWRAAASGATGSWQRITGGVTGTLATITGRVRAFGSTVQTGLTAPFRAFAGWMQKSMPATWGQLNIGLQLVRRRAASTAAGLRASFGGFASWIGSHLPAAFQKAMRGAGAAIQKIGPIASALGATITGTLSASLNGVRAAAETAGAAIQAMYGNFIPVLGPIFNFVRGGISSIIGLAGRLGGALLSPLSMLKNFVMSWRGMLAGLGVSLGAAGIGKYIVGSFADAEKAQVAFTTMLGGSEEAAKRLLGELQKLGDTTPLELPELRDAAKTLLAMGTNAGDVTENLRMIGDVSTGVTVPIGHLASIWGKISLSNKIQGDELRQMSDNGIPIVAELAKKYGTTTEAIYKMGEAGTLSFNDLQETFRRLTGEGGRFHGMMAKIGQTLGGRWSTLKDTVRAVAVSFGEKVAPALKKALDFGIQFAEGLKTRLEPLKALLAKWADNISRMLPKFMAIGNQALPLVQQGIETVLSVSQAVSGVVGEIVAKFGDWVGGAGNVVSAISTIMAKIKAIADNWKLLFDIAGGYLNHFVNNGRSVLGGLFDDLRENVTTFFSKLPELLGLALIGMQNVLGPFIDSVAERVQWAFTKWMPGSGPAPELKFGQVGPLLANEMKKQFGELFDNMPGFKRFADAMNPNDPALDDKLDKFRQAWDAAVGKPMAEAAQAANQVAAGNGKRNANQQGQTPPKAIGKRAEGKFAFMGLEEFYKHVQQGISGKDGVVIAKQQLDVNKKQLAIMLREEAARKNATHRGNVSVFG